MQLCMCHLSKDVTRTMLTEVDKVIIMHCTDLKQSCTQEGVKKLIEQKMTVGIAKLRLLPRTGGVKLIENMGSHLNLPFM